MDDPAGKHVGGRALTALRRSLEIGANHPQITYYFLLAMAAFWISEGIAALRDKRLGDFWKRTAVLAAAGILARRVEFLAPVVHRQPLQRDHARRLRTGLDLRDFAGRAGARLRHGLELRPHGEFQPVHPEPHGRFVGTTLLAGRPGGRSSRQFRCPSRRPAIGTYWGDQPGTAGPTYLGAAVVFLAVLGLFVLRGSRKWWLLAVSLLALFLSWGSNMMWFTELCFKILPGYNKFRAVSTALVIVQWTFPLLACLLLSELWKGEIPARKIRRGLAWATGITGGIALLFALFGPKMFGFSAPGDYPLLYNIAAHSGFNEAGRVSSPITYRTP